MISGTANEITTEQCEISIPQEYSVLIKQNQRLEEFVWQFQHICDKILCIVNGTHVRFLDKKNPNVDNHVSFYYKLTHPHTTEYYFRDRYDNVYCIFGIENAKCISHDIDENDIICDDTAEDIQAVCVYEENVKDIKDNEKIQNSSGFESILTQCDKNCDRSDQTDKADCEQIDKYNYKQNTKKAYSSRRDKAYKTHLMLPITANINKKVLADENKQTQKRPPIITQLHSKKSQSYNNNDEIYSKNMQSYSNNTRFYNVSEHMTRGHVVIIDNGNKMSFPNKDLPIEVTTYAPDLPCK